MSMPELPDGVVVELESQPSRTTVHIEDALIILCLIPLWLPVFGVRGTWVTLVMVAALILMVAVLRRRKRRVDNLFAELRRRQEMLDAVGGYPMLPGMMPPHPDRQSAAVELDESR